MPPSGDRMELLDEIYRWPSERVAHAWRDCRLTYGELRARAGALATFLHGTLPRGEPVAVIGHKHPDMLTCFLACIEAGHPYVPIDSGLPPARIATILQHARSVLTLSPGDELDAIVATHTAERPPRDVRVRDHENVYIMFTSGSTGVPKGVQITLANLTGFLAWARDVHPITTGQRFLNQAPFSFDLSVMDTYLSLISGGTLHSVDRAMIENPLELRELLPRIDVEVWVSTPSFARMCVADRAFSASRMPSLACFLFCGEALDAALVRDLHARFPAARVYNTYGPTEATVAVTSILVDAALAERFPILPLGTPRPDTKVEIVDGEIVIEGPCVSPGYLHAPFASARYRTGDAGRYEDGMLLFGGRLDDQVKLFGHRIELDDVAANLAALPAVAKAIVIPVLRAGRCEALAAFVVLRDDAPVNVVRDQLAARVPSYMVPRDIIVRDALPMTSNGKIDRQRLAAELR